MIRDYCSRAEWEAAAQAAGFYVWPVPARPLAQLDVAVGETPGDLLLDNAYRGLTATEGPPDGTWPRQDVVGFWCPAIPDVGQEDGAVPARGTLAETAAQYRDYCGLPPRPAT